MSQISLEGIEFYAHHGIHESEKEQGNDFLVNVIIDANIKEASLKDNLEDTIDYEKVYYIIAREMAIPSKLLEHVAKRILIALDNEFDDNIKDIAVEVCKLNPPLHGKCQKASVKISLLEGLPDLQR